MNAITVAFTVAVSALLLTVPRRLAVIPLLLGALYAGAGAEIQIGPANFTVLRILVAIGFVRALARSEKVAGGVNEIDKAVLLWVMLLMGTSAFHVSGAWVFRAGLVWSQAGCYFLLRVFVRDLEDLRRTFRAICVLLVPLALLMLVEKATAQNLFAVLGADAAVEVREGLVRARGPFAHGILAGTVGAACWPIGLFMWRKHRNCALAGLFGAGGIVFASTSSGPVMMMLFIALGMAFWKVRHNLAAIRWLALIGIVALDLVMKAPVYYLMARIDIAGGSRGWHRARLIESAIEHIDEWWLIGTDYTRHWMPTGIHANATHTDITNHFLSMGVMGGLPLMFAFIMILVATFRGVGKALRKHKGARAGDRFLIWTVGAVLFGHVLNFFSISLFDQSVVFFYLVLAAIGAALAGQAEQAGMANSRIGTRPRAYSHALARRDVQGESS